jgi:hypothetical protein
MGGLAMVARGYAKARMGRCGCSFRAMVAISGDGQMQALICSDPAMSGGYLCVSCQQVCRTLNAALEVCNFAQAARLTPEHFRLNPDSRPHLSVALGILHEAMLEAILEFESRALPLGMPEPESQYGHLIGAYA